MVPLALDFDTFVFFDPLPPNVTLPVRLDVIPVDFRPLFFFLIPFTPCFGPTDLKTVSLLPSPQSLPD
jgi:hypothetical protein